LRTLSSKAAFTTNVDPRELIAAERTRRPWMSHSVAVLIVSPRVDQIALVLPEKAAKRQAEHVRVPPQRAVLPDDMVEANALTLVRSLLTVPVRPNDLHFLGSARGNVHRGGQREQYGKWVHWVGLRLNERNGVFKKGSSEFQLAYWCDTNQLLSMDTSFAMSQRKYLMTLQALTAYHCLGVEGVLIRKARERLSLVA